MQEKKILIIKFGGLGDIVLSLNAIYSIKKKFKNKIFLLTEKPYESFFQKSKWFEKIITIRRSLIYSLDILEIKRKLDVDKIEKVFDLQTSRRSSYYLKIFNERRSEINGIGKFANKKHNNKNRNEMHTIPRQEEQLKISNIKFQKKPDLNWLFKSEKVLNMGNKISLIVPGGSKKRMNKRIPLEIYDEIIKTLLTRSITPILIGADDDETVCRKLKKKFPTIKNLCNETNFFQIAYLSKKSLISFGNDTGPMHIISRGNNPTFVFYTNNSNPNLCRQIGGKTFILNYENNHNLFLSKIFKELQKVSNN